MSDTKTHRIPPLLLVRLALLAALSAVLKLAQVPVGNDFLRISFENLPILLAGYLFGPFAGGAVGVAAAPLDGGRHRGGARPGGWGDAQHAAVAGGAGHRRVRRGVTP